MNGGSTAFALGFGLLSFVSVPGDAQRMESRTTERIMRSFRDARASTVRTGVSTALQELERTAGSSWRALSNDSLGTAAWIDLAIAESDPPVSLTDATPEGALQKFLPKARSLWGIESERSALQEVKRVQDEFGYWHYRLQQVFDGLPVYGGEAIAHVRRDASGRWHAYAAGGTIYPIEQLAHGRGLSADAAAQSAVSQLRDRGWSGATAINQWILPVDSVYVAAWEVVESSVADDEQGVADEEGAFIRADNGAVLSTYSTMRRAAPARRNDRALQHEARRADQSNDKRKFAFTAYGMDVGLGFDVFGNQQTVFTVPESPSQYVMKDITGAQSVWTYDVQGLQIISPSESYLARDTDNQWDGPLQIDEVSGSVNSRIVVAHWKDKHGRTGMRATSLIQHKTLVNYVTGFDAFYSPNSTYEYPLGFSSGGSSIQYSTQGHFGDVLPLVASEDIVFHEFSHGIMDREDAVDGTNSLEILGMGEALADYFGASYRNSPCIADTVIMSSAYTPNGTPLPVGCTRDIESDIVVGGAYYESWRSQSRYHVMGVAVSSALWDARKHIIALSPSSGYDHEAYDKIVYRALVYYLSGTPNYLYLRQGIVRAAQDLEEQNVIPRSIPIAFYTEREFYDNNIGPLPLDVELTHNTRCCEPLGFAVIVDGPPNTAFTARMEAGTALNNDESVAGTPLAVGTQASGNTGSTGQVVLSLPNGFAGHAPGDGHYHSVRVRVTTPNNNYVGELRYFDSDLEDGSRRPPLLSLAGANGPGTQGASTFTLSQRLATSAPGVSADLTAGHGGTGSAVDARALVQRMGITALQFGVPEIEQGRAFRVRITIYDMSGRLVRRAVDSDFTPGVYDWRWDLRSDAGQQVPAGSYVAIMEAEGHRQRRVLVVR